MNSQITFPISSDGWIPLKNQLGSKVVFRAVSIEKSKKRKSEPSGHMVDEAIAEGSVKIRSKLLDISKFPANASI